MTRTRSPTADLSPEVAWYLESRGVPLPDCPPRWKTPEPRDVRGAKFDPSRVDRVLNALRRLRHTQGEWAGRPLNPDPWQVGYIIAPVFGWVRRNDRDNWVRIIRSLYVDIPRKNGKTTLSGGIAMYMTAADGEPGAQVYALAASKDQARYCFDPVKAIAEKSPDLKSHVRVTASRIVHTRSSSYFAVAASLADLIHGANIHCANVDELHIHKTRDLVDAVETGTGARSQPLVCIITTADEGKPGTIYDEKRRYVEQLARGAIEDPATYGVVWAADEADEHGEAPFAEATWRKANPGYGISPTREFMQSEARKARENPANLSRFLRLHLGIRTKQQTRYLTLDAWDASAGMVDETKLDGRKCYGGIDLSSVSDLTSVCWTFPDGGGGYDAIWRHFLPEAALDDLAKRTADAARVWVREGWLRLTPGNVLDNDYVLDQIDRDAQRFEVATVGFDRWGANDLVRRLTDGGLTCVGIGQGFASLNGPLKELLRLVLSGQYRHGGNPVMRWMVDNLAVAMDPAGNVKPDKATSHDKIDGISAALNALKECVDAEAEQEGVMPWAAFG